MTPGLSVSFLSCLLLLSSFSGPEPKVMFFLFRQEVDQRANQDQPDNANVFITELQILGDYDLLLSLLRLLLLLLLLLCVLLWLLWEEGR